VQNLRLERIRAEAARMEEDAAQFYVRAAQASSDPDTRKLLGDLAAAERQHEQKAEELKGSTLNGEVGHQEDDKAKRQFILTWVQPGLAGLMDGSVSTLAPIFATAFATQSTSPVTPQAVDRIVDPYLINLAKLTNEVRGELAEAFIKKAPPSELSTQIHHRILFPN
jgi:rubrerythrin